MAKRSVVHVTDFSGGYSSDLPDERMAANMLRTGENLYWEAGLRKREGVSRYGETFPSTANIIYGHIRAYMNGKWTHVTAVSLTASDTVLRFMTDNATAKTFVEIDNTFTHTAAPIFIPERYRFSLMKVNGEDAVIGVDSSRVEKPFVIYYDSGFKIKTLEEYDIRTRDNDFWYAGKYDVSEGNPYFDYTSEAQSDTADDFPLTSTTIGDGFYISGILTFNKVLFTSASQFSAAVAVYEYYQGDDTWASLGTLVQTPAWTAAVGDRTLEFDYPQDWAKWDGLDAQTSVPALIPDTLYNRFVIRVRFTTAPDAAQTADTLTLYHSQYLTQIMAGDIPHQLHVHNSRLFLASGSNVNYSPYGLITGWNEYDTESFIRGGNLIQKMVTHKGYLCIFKGAAIYGLLGNSVDNWVVKELDPTIGSNKGSSVVVINQTVFFIGTDKYIYGFNGEVSKKISKHVHSDISADAVNEVFSVNHKGWYIANMGSNRYKFDPDSVREDDLGDGIVSIWKYTGSTTIENSIYFDGDGDNSKLIGIGQGRFYETENGKYYDEDGAGNIDITIDYKSKDLSFGEFGLKKNYNRIKPDVEKAGDYTLTLLSDHESDNIAVTLASETGPGQYTEDVSVPYEIDGKDLTLRLQNTSSVYAAIYGFALNVARRVF